jgi:hypothetical protein
MAEIVSRLLLVLLCCASGPAPGDLEPPARAKLGVDLDALNEAGLAGPPDGLRAVAYEFCIPARPELAAAVRAIDPTVEIYSASPGRIGCTADERLCIGSTHQPEYRRVLLELAGLDYVARIEPSYGD